MKMENLNKTQIVLLTLLTSFVTSIATGIVTVTLMEQAPPAVTRTINRVINKTIQTVIPSEKQITTVVNKVVVVKEKDLIVGAVEKVSKSLAQLNIIDKEGKRVSVGLGVVVSKDGIIIANKSKITDKRDNLVASIDGKLMKVKVLSEESDFAVLKVVGFDISTTTTKKINKDNIAKANTSDKTKGSEVVLNPISLFDSGNVKLGQSIIVLGGSDGKTVLTGIVSQLEMEAVPNKVVNKKDDTNKEKNKKLGESKKILKYIVPSFVIDKKSAGGPMLDINGGLIGVNVLTPNGKILAIPANVIKNTLYDIANPTKEISKNTKNIDNSSFATSTTKFATSTDGLTGSK